MNNTYCLRCKKKTSNRNPRKISNRLSSTCSVCGAGKSTFVKAQKGGLDPLTINAVSGAVGAVGDAVGKSIGALSERGSVASNNIVKKGIATGKYERMKDKRNLKTYRRYIKAGIPADKAMQMAFDN